MFGLGIQLNKIDENVYSIDIKLKEVRGFERLITKIIRLLFQEPNSDCFHPQDGVGLSKLRESQLPITIASITEKILQIPSWLRNYEAEYPEKEDEAKLKKLELKGIHFEGTNLIIELKIETFKERTELALKI